MSQILLWTADDKTRRLASKTLQALGHRVRAVDSLAAARQALGSLPADLVVVDTDDACLEGRDAVRALRVDGRPLIVWTGVGVDSGLGLVFAEVPDGVLSSPINMASASATLSRLERQAGSPGPNLDDLGLVDGPCELFPPFRVLWAACLARATGRLELWLDDREREIQLQDGRIVALHGFLDEEDGDEDSGLETLVGRAIGRGERPDVAMDAVARKVAATLAAAVGRSGGMVFFDPQAEPPERALPLPVALPRLLAEALRQERPIAAVRRMLGPHRSDLLIPGTERRGSTELPPVALRLLRSADRSRVLGELIGEDDEAWLAADLLLQLGLARLVARDVPTLPSEEASPPAVPDERGRRGRARSPEPQLPASAEEDGPAPSPADPVADELEADLRRLETLEPVALLGIVRSSDLVQKAVDERFRLLSARFHPDRFRRESERVTELARECFSLVNEAYTILRQPGVLDEARARMTAREQGRAHVTDADRRRARLQFARGEIAFRKKGWAEATAALQQAHEADPTDWRTTFLLTRSKLEAGKIGPEEAAVVFRGLSAPEGRSRSDLLHHLGEALLASGKEKEAYEHFERAVAEWPEHVEARRRVRLRSLRKEGSAAVHARDAIERAARDEKRSGEKQAERRKAPPEPGSAEQKPAEESPASTVSGILSGIFRRGGGGGGKGGGR